MKIIALGDSLTVGESEFELSGADSTSYPEYLETLAHQYLSSRKSTLHVNVLNRGISGELTSGMIERFSDDVVGEKPDHVIILGGTNDVGWGFDPATITHNLSVMYDAAQNAGIAAVACSIPSILGFDELIPPRLSLNSMIRTEAMRRSLALVDFFTATADPSTNRLSEDYSSDGLHLNPKGYREMGRCAFDSWLKPLLDQQSRLEI